MTETTPAPSENLANVIATAVSAQLRSDPAFIASVRDELVDTNRVATTADQRKPTIQPRWVRRAQMLAELDNIGTSTQDRYRQRGLIDQRSIGRANLYDRYSIIGLSEMIRFGLVKLVGQTDGQDARAREILNVHLTECNALEEQNEQFLSSYAVRRLAETRMTKVVAEAA